MRRHFVEHDDLDLFVATSGEFDEPGVASLRLLSPAWLKRIRSTRFWRLVQNFEMLFWSERLPHDLVEAAEAFKPDAIFTVADLSLSEAARRLAHRLKVPLITNFQDWWPLGQFYYAQERPYSFLVPLFEERFRRLYRESSLAFCTSEGMREFLGSHPNSHVLYPIGARENESVDHVPELKSNISGKRRLIYTGTAFGSYGEMLRSLAKELRNSETWELIIYGARPDWPADELAQAEQIGLYRGFLPFEKLKEELASADVCLAVMSFDPALEVMMRTSFTTKLLDYCKAGKPIIMWGPEYCAPVRMIKKQAAAWAITTPDAKEVVEALMKIREDFNLREDLSQGAKRLAKGDLSHDKIHGVFVEQITALINKDD
jgi:glycosyltransferase involved in cell wall biosynthesis